MSTKEDVSKALEYAARALNSAAKAVLTIREAEPAVSLAAMRDSLIDLAAARRDDALDALMANAQTTGETLTLSLPWGAGSLCFTPYPPLGPNWRGEQRDANGEQLWSNARIEVWATSSFEGC